MRGYIENADSKLRVISGWAYESGTGVSSGGLVIYAALDGAIVGSSAPWGTRADLRAKVSESEHMVFSVNVNVPFTVDDILSGRLTITAVSPISLTPLILTNSEERRLRELSGARSSTPSAPVQSSASLTGTIPHPRVAASQGCLTPIYLPVGMKSSDGTAQLGKQGHLFLTGGTNGLIDQNKPMAAERLTSLVDQWINLFERRETLSQKRGIQYIQTIVPEKLTVLRKHAPEPIDGPTPLYSALDSVMAKHAPYVSGMAPFEDWRDGDDPFLKNDSHFSPAGARAAFISLIEPINPQLAGLVGSIPMDHHVYGMGDLVNRFYGMPIYCRRAEPAPEQMAPYTRQLVQTEKYTPVKGHIGSRFSWENKNALDPRRVLVFGNSFFGTGDRARELSWWAKHFFKEVYFVWDPKFDWNHVELLRPDIVIGQTIERFLPQVPVE